jgi:hypothetical protein
MRCHNRLSGRSQFVEVDRNNRAGQPLRRRRLCRDKVCKVRKLYRGKDSLHEQRVKLPGGGSRDVIGFHLPFVVRMHGLDDVAPVVGSP